MYESRSESTGRILSQMIMTSKPKFTVLTMRTTSVLITFPSDVIWITFRAHLQFHSDPSSSTRILEFFVRLNLFTRMLESFTRKTIFHSDDDHIFSRKTIFYLIDQFSLDLLLNRPFTRSVGFHSTFYSIGRFSLDLLLDP